MTRNIDGFCPHTGTCALNVECHSRRKLAASARISRSGCFLNRVFVLKSCSWLKVFSAANGLECIRGQSNPLSNFVLSAKLCRFWRPLIAVSDNLRFLSRQLLISGSPTFLSFFENGGGGS